VGVLLLVPTAGYATTALLIIHHQLSTVDEASGWFKADFGLGAASRVAHNKSAYPVAILQEQVTSIQ
jgi:hypothetical protein